MTGAFATEERRRHVRGEIEATCDVFSPARHLGTFPVRDLSAGGARLVGNVPLQPGAPVRVVLQMPKRPALGIAARVLQRQDLSRSGQFAVQFCDLSPAEESTIQQRVVAEMGHFPKKRYASVLIVDPAAEVREALARDLRALGKDALCVGTPLEAICWLTNPEASFETVIVNLTTGGQQALDILEFLGSERPLIRRYAVGSSEAKPQSTVALRSGVAEAFLTQPWSRRDLAGLIEVTWPGR